MIIKSTADGSEGIIAFQSASNTGAGQIYGHTNDLKFYTVGKYLFTNSKPVCINTTTDNGSKLSVKYNGTTHAGICVQTTRDADGSSHIIFKDSDANTIGAIHQDGASSTAYGTSSDYRLKENVDYTWDATTRLKQLKPSRFNFIAEADKTVDGFLAHEVSNIVPEAIMGEKDGTETFSNAVINSAGNKIDDDVTEAEWTAGKADDKYDADTTWKSSHTQNAYQSIDQSKLVPLLVKTIQELEARITTLESA
jgi:hypothetical protein